MIKRFFIPILVLLVVVACGLAYWLHDGSRAKKSPKDLIPVIRTTLTNGFEIIVVPTSRVPAVTHMLWVKAGGADDPAAIPGLAHFLEHMMFTGTPAYPQGAYDATITKLGGEHNAFTSYDATAYYATVPKEHLETVMSLEADRLMNLDFSDSKAAREASVIAEERRMRVDNQPASQLREQLRAVQYLVHPYRQPLIGWPGTIATFKAADARKFRDTYYRASNMVLVVVGDVDPAQVHKLAANHYGKMPTMPVPSRAWPAEPELVTERSVRLRDARVQQPRLIANYTVASLGTTGATKTAFTLDVLGEYLGAARTGLLYRALVRDQKIATEIGVDADGWSKGPGTLSITMALADGITLEQAQKALDTVLTQVASGTPSRERLAQAQTTLAAGALYAQDGLMSLANVMGNLASLGLKEDVFYEWQESIHAVTAPEVGALAETIFTRSPKVIGYLEPKIDEAPHPEPSVPMAQLGGSYAY